jgi:hypothetical protein
VASASCMVPGSPSPVGRKPGICQTGQLVTREGPEGSNPSPGAYFEEPNISLKALAGESRIEVATTNMDELTESKTKQQKQIMTTTTTTTDTGPNSSRLQASYSPHPQGGDDISNSSLLLFIL